MFKSIKKSWDQRVNRYIRAQRNTWNKEKSRSRDSGAHVIAPWPIFGIHCFKVLRHLQTVGKEADMLSYHEMLCSYISLLIKIREILLWELSTSAFVFITSATVGLQCSSFYLFSSSRATNVNVPHVGSIAHWAERVSYICNENACV